MSKMQKLKKKPQLDPPIKYLEVDQICVSNFFKSEKTYDYNDIKKVIHDIVDEAIAWEKIKMIKLNCSILSFFLLNL